MKRVLALLLACFVSFSTQAQVGGPIIGQGGCTNNCTFTGSTVITGGNTPFVLAHYAIPIDNGGSGSMGNNGAVTFTTALAKAYPNFYVLFPAGAIAAGVPAAPDYYFVQMSSTTVGTVFNNTLSANLDSFGGPKIPASPTAFVTTGPGAFTAATTATTMMTWALPANTIGINGELYLEFAFTPTSNANAKNATVSFGGANIVSQSLASTATAYVKSTISNMASASVQSSENFIVINNAITGTFQVYPTANTANAVNIIFQTTHSGAATDHIVLEKFSIRALTP